VAVGSRILGKMAQQIKVGETVFEVDLGDEMNSGGTVNGVEFSWDVSRLSDSVYHVIKNHRAYNVEILEVKGGEAVIKVNGHVHRARIQDEFSELLKRLGMERNASAKVNELKAPMPGLVLSVDVEPGMALKKGDRVLILEAMKMENAIKAPADATVASIEVKKGDTVEKNQVMVRFA